MVIGLTMTGVVLALSSAVLLRQHRVVSELADRADLAARLRDGAGPLLAQLRTLSPEDLRDARDTALELRATIASAIVCDTTATALVLAPAARDQRFAAFAAPIALDASLRRACAVCASVISARRFSSRASSSAERGANPRFARPASKACGFSRMDRMSCMTVAMAGRAGARNPVAGARVS